MKLKTKIYLDNLFGFPAVFSINLISKLLLLLKHRKEPDYSNVKRIAVCKFMGMGSIIQSTPLLMTIRRRFPETEIIFITLPKNVSLLGTFPFVDKILTINDRSALGLITSILKFLFYIWMNQIDILIDLEVHSYFSRILTALSFSKYKIGFYKKESNIQLGIYSKMAFYNAKAPVHRIYLQTAHFLYCKEYIADLYDWKCITNGLQVTSIFQSRGLASPLKEYIIINPNASDLRIERRWASVNYIGLIQRIICDYPEINIVLTGAQKEVQYVNSIYNGIKEEFRSRVVNSSGELALQDLIALINGCILMITNDSGPMHIAFALRKNTIALFGPCAPLDYGINSNVYSVYKNLYCSPCVHHFAISPCNGENKCMKLISNDEVMKCVSKILGSNTKCSSPHSNERILYDSIEDGLVFGIVERKS